jgi:HEAT repeat protein
MLAKVLEGTDPFGEDLPMVLDTLVALGSFRDDRAVLQIAAVARRKQWMAWGKTRKLREASLRTLARIGTPKARQALDDLAKNGDFFLRRQAAAALRTPA